MDTSCVGFLFDGLEFQVLLALSGVELARGPSLPPFDEQALDPALNRLEAAGVVSRVGRSLIVERGIANLFRAMGRAGAWASIRLGDGEAFLYLHRALCLLVESVGNLYRLIPFECAEGAKAFLLERVAALARADQEVVVVLSGGRGEERALAVSEFQALDLAALVGKAPVSSDESEGLPWKP